MCAEGQLECPIAAHMDNRILRRASHVNPPNRISVAQFVAMLPHYPLKRKITSIHLHHTWRPNHVQWRGAASIEAMRNYHVKERQFRDIAQHLTIDPAGGLWLGRDWNLPPASSLGVDASTKIPVNGTERAGPFMIEMVGDFDEGKDRLEGAQYDAVIATLTAICGRFGLEASSIRAHTAMQHGKSCPGSTLYAGADGGAPWKALHAAVTNTMPTALAESRATSTPSISRVRALIDANHDTRAVGPVRGETEGDVPEDARAADRMTTAATDTTADLASARGAVDPKSS